MIKTAIYHFEAKVISRGAGRSAVAAAAYQSGEQLYNDYDGITHDYTKKTGVLFSEILLPDMAPAEWADRQTLWNAVEQAEKAKDSRLARQLIVALPTELTMQDWQAMLHQFVLEECVAKGMCADFAIHDTDGHNPHAHIMLTVRPLDANGKWQAKTQKEYLCRRGEEKGFTAAEFRQAQSEGWEKLYKYRNESGVTGWFTPSEAALHPTWERTSKQPKATKFGRQNPICEAWNSEVQLLEWRERWAEYINRALEQQQRSERVTHLSHAALGLSEQPTVHEGYHARNLEKQGMIADRCELNRQIRADNKLLRELKSTLQKLTKAAEYSISRIAQALETLRDKIIVAEYQLIRNHRRTRDYQETRDMFNLSLYPNDRDSSHPIQSFSGKEVGLERFLHAGLDKDASDEACREAREKILKQMAPIIPDIFILWDTVERHFTDASELIGKRYGRKKYSNYDKETRPPPPGLQRTARLFGSPRNSLSSGCCFPCVDQR